MTNPVVSIVITTQSHCHFLKEAVASIFAQSFERWELIVVGHASEDETWTRLSEFKDPRVIMLRLEQHVERSTARNKGLAVAKGEFVLFLNEDELLMQPALQVHLEALAQHPRAIASVAGLVEFDMRGIRKRDKLVQRSVERDLWPDIMFGWIAIAGQCMFRAPAIKASNGWNEDLRETALADHALWLRLARAGPAVLLPEILFKRRCDSGQLQLPEQWKLLTKLRKRAAQKLDAEDYESAQGLLKARDDFRSAMTHYRQGKPGKSFGFFLKALRAAPGLLRSPLAGPMLAAPMLQCLGGAPIFRSWLQHWSKKFDIPLRHVVAARVVAFNDKNKSATLNFFDRSKLLGLEHELRWYGAKTVAAEQWRKLAGRYQWIFILGCNNSGTTLMTRLLEAHPAISGVPRGGRGATIVLLPPRRAEVIRLWTEKIELFRLTEADQHLEALRLIYDWISAVQFSTRPFILEKAPPDMICSRWFQAVFPNAAFIGLARNGYAVAEGMNRREGYSLERCARHWNTANKIMMDDAAHLKRFMLVQYEDLTADTRATMRKICRFLGIDLDPLRDVIDQEWRVHNMDNAPAKIQDFNIRSLARLSQNEIDVISRHAGEMLARFGYAIHKPDRMREELALEV